MAKRFVFRQAVNPYLSFKEQAARYRTEPRQFAEPSREQIEKAKETWRQLAPKKARGLLK